jgi:hypothetical protein
MRGCTNQIPLTIRPKGRNILIYFYTTNFTSKMGQRGKNL